MAEIDNLSKGELGKIWAAIRELRYASPVNNTAIGRDGLTVYDGGVITIENGGLRVTGTAEIIGELIASGSIIFNGPVRITGPFDVEGLTQIMGDLVLAAGGTFTAGTIELNPDGSAKFGTLTISPTGKLTSGQAIINPDGSAKFGQFDIAANGNLDSKGTLDIKGKSTLQDDLEVKGGGKVKVGGMTLDPTVASGAVTFSNGAQVYTNGSSIQMFRGDGVVQVAGDRAAIQWGGAAFSVDAGGRRISNLPPTTEKPNLYVNSSGYLFRSTAE